MMRRLVAFMISFVLILSVGVGQTFASNGNQGRVGVEKHQSKILYHVIADSFKNKADADRLVDRLKKKKFDAIIKVKKGKGVPWYSVQVGAFASHKNAKRQVLALKQAGFVKARIVVERTPVKLIYRVIAGSFYNKNAAIKRQSDLKRKQIDSFIRIVKINKHTHYVVQVGAFQETKNADRLLKRLKELGYKDSYLEVIASR